MILLHIGSMKNKYISKRKLPAYSFFAKIVMLFLLLSQVLQTYGYGKYNITFILMTLSSIVYVTRYGFRLYSLPKIIGLYLIYWLIVHIVTAVSLTEMIPLGTVKTFLVFLMLFNIFEINYFIRYYRIFALIFIIFFFFQEFTYFTTGLRIPGIADSLPLALDVEDETSYFSRVETMDRSSSFFSEPSHFAQFLIPLYAIELFKTHKGHLLFALIVGLTILMTQTGNGIIGLVVVSSIFVIHKIFSRGTLGGRVLLLIFTFATLSIATSIFMNSERGEKLFEREDQLSGKDDASNGDNSGFIRIFRGYYIYSDYSLADKIIGVDSPTRLKSYIKQSDFSYTFGDNDTYLNCFQTFLLHTGLIGAIFFFVIMKYFWRQADLCGRAVLSALFALSFVASIYFREIMAIYLLTSLYSKDYKGNRTKPTLIRKKTI